MFTIKQMEALYWVSTLGSFEAAADYLNMVQSTISKRIGELEARFSTPLFHRTGRKPVLTTKGEEIRAIAEQILRLNDRLNSLAKKSSVPSFRFRLGVTDLVALSWLPELLSGILDRYPMITLEPEIDLTASLLERLVDRRLDFVICPRVIQEPQFVSTPLGAIELVWMCSPKLLDGKDNATLSDLTKHPLLIQTTGSILRPILHSVIDDPNLPFKRTISCNNMVALAHLAAHGMGVTILPHAFFRNMVADGRLCVVRTEMELPNLEYFATFRNDYHVQFCEEVAALSAEICDFRLQ
ncbi:LysR family transcriptional regulator [Aminobacter sp. Y103A]|uniref:LysR family transcriptional regulator n=1 Tax=Aminobacter sp. Y103A TaxID=1870862 RepID=UPI0025732D5A|nr:LysR family transcriptional regulator [Aminobacter sp. SS-2016]BBD40278.1 LysR family transcriptional regulator [Aminobacter sp. SS-2016]